MTYGGRHPLTPSEVHSYSTTVTQGELDLTLALLAGDTSRDGAVCFIRQPVLTSNPLKLQDSI